MTAESGTSTSDGKYLADIELRINHLPEYAITDTPENLCAVIDIINEKGDILQHYTKQVTKSNEIKFEISYKPPLGNYNVRTYSFGYYFSKGDSTNIKAHPISSMVTIWPKKLIDLGSTRLIIKTLDSQGQGR